MLLLFIRTETKKDNERHVSMYSRYPLPVRNLSGFSESYPIILLKPWSSTSFSDTKHMYSLRYGSMCPFCFLHFVDYFHILSRPVHFPDFMR